MPQSNYNEIVEKYVEMNIVHPSKEGDSRSMRIWLDAILKKEIKNDYLFAMKRNSIKDLEIKLLLKDTLTDKINYWDIYIKGIDASYKYEGYNLYQTNKL